MKNAVFAIGDRVKPIYLESMYKVSQTHNVFAWVANDDVRLIRKIRIYAAKMGFAVQIKTQAEMKEFINSDSAIDDAFVGGFK